MTTQTTLISAYLRDETMLLHDWYQQIKLSQHPDLEPITTFPSLEELKAMAKMWWQALYRKHQAFFQKVFCQKLRTGENACAWWRRIRDKSHLYQEFIVALVDQLVLSPLLAQWQIVVTLTLIVHGRLLDIVCREVNCNG